MAEIDDLRRRRSATAHARRPTDGHDHGEPRRDHRGPMGRAEAAERGARDELADRRTLVEMDRLERRYLEEPRRGMGASDAADRLSRLRSENRFVAGFDTERGRQLEDWLIDHDPIGFIRGRQQADLPLDPATERRLGESLHDLRARIAAGERPLGQLEARWFDAADRLSEGRGARPTKTARPEEER